MSAGWHRIVGMGVLLIATLACAVFGDPLTIYEIQSNTSDGDASIYDGDLVECAGGIVIGKFQGFKPRIMLQDPNFPNGWGGIHVKDWSPNYDLYDAVEIGDHITLANVTVEEYRGNTLLQWYPDDQPVVTHVSQGNDLPPPISVTVSQIPGPICTEDGCFVENHDAELYEAMRVVVHDVIVGQKGLGKAEDNYELLQESDIAWAADYMNADAGGPYDPRIETGAHLARLSGMFEQYTKQEPLWGWDYYQVCTLSADDIVLAEDVPAVSDCGLIALALLVLVVGTVVLRRVPRGAGPSDAG